MSSTVHCCATEGIEETIDRYNNAAERNPKVREAEKRVKDIIGWIRNALIEGKDPEEIRIRLDELDDEYVNMGDEKLLAFAQQAKTDAQFAYNLGLEYGRLEEREKRPHQDDMDDGRQE